MRANLEAFQRWRIVPRMLIDISRRDMSTEVLGTRMPAPVMLGPIGVQGIVHPDAELASASAAASVGLPIVLSTASSRSMEEVAAANGDSTRWYQLYWPADEAVTKSFLSRIEDNGYTAIVVTVDVFLLGWRPRDLQRGFLPFLKGEGIANYLADPQFRATLDQDAGDDVSGAVLKWIEMAGLPRRTWEDLASLRENSNLPLLLKGIVHPDDARLAREHGIDGIVVSNHGGRQVDGALAALDALPPVVEAVGDELPILFDSGIRSGADAFKALCLGASAVLLGRPYIWALAVGGQQGVEEFLRNFLAELDITFGLSGCTSIDQLDAARLVRI